MLSVAILIWLTTTEKFLCLGAVRIAFLILSKHYVLDDVLVLISKPIFKIGKSGAFSNMELSFMQWLISTFH